MVMVRKRPCACCGKWFRPDPRVGDRQRTCATAECRKWRRARAQAAWLSRQPEYMIARRIQERAKRKEKEGRAPAPLRVPRPLDQLPWDVAQDEFGVQGADFLGFLAKVLTRHAKDEIATQVLESTKEIRGQRAEQVKDEKRAGA